MLFRSARAVVPVSRPPLADGAVLVHDGYIRRVGSWKRLASQATGRGIRIVDLGDAALLPGLVNAHAHLDYTGMAGQLAPTGSFTDWIKLITALKASWSAADFVRSWATGARLLVETGTTTVADIEAMPELLPQAWEGTPLRVLSFLEMTGVRSRRDPEAIVAETTARAAALPVGRCRVGLSPHAPYSTTPALLTLAAGVARARRWRLTVHVAESDEEFDMFQHACGPMFDWLQRNARDMSDCGGCSPVAALTRCGLLGPNLLAVHANYVEAKDLELLARHGASVVHCPRSHAFFGHRPFAYPSFVQAGINVCLGTDSLATAPHTPHEPARLDLFAEMLAFAAAFPGVTPLEVLQLATTRAAAALGQPRRLGRLARGAFADLIAVPFRGELASLPEAVLNHHGPVSVSMIGGQWALPPRWEPATPTERPP